MIQRHPSILVLNVALSVFLFSVPAFFALGDPKRIQCASDGIRAADQDNNLVCAAQGNKSNTPSLVRMSNQIYQPTYRSHFDIRIICQCYVVHYPDRQSAPSYSMEQSFFERQVHCYQCNWMGCTRFNYEYRSWTSCSEIRICPFMSCLFGAYL